MSTHTFDTLLSALSSSVTEAQKSVSRHHQGQLRRLYTDDSGNSLTWTFYVPSDAEDDGDYRPIELPLVSLRSHRELNISELSIELTCSVKTASAGEIRRLQRPFNEQDDISPPSPGADEMERPLILILKTAKQAIVNNLTRIRILLNAKKTQGRVLVNDQEFKRFDLHDRS